MSLDEKLALIRAAADRASALADARAALPRDPPDLDPNDLAFWFDKLKATGVLVPKTHIIRAQGPLWSSLLGPGEPDTPALAPLLDELQAAGTALGYPVFLRTGHSSGKHSWRYTCYVPNAASMAAHVAALIEWSECADFMGLPYDTWAVRELLPLTATFHAFSGKMPINCERRYFIEGGQVICHHPYWPPSAIRDPDCENWAGRLAVMNAETHDEVQLLAQLSQRVSRAFEGAWSLDWAQTIDGDWYAIDMARAGDSYHWPGCPADKWHAAAPPPEPSETQPEEAAGALLVPIPRSREAGST